jgi:hypothetical protein
MMRLRQMYLHHLYHLLSRQQLHSGSLLACLSSSFAGLLKQQLPLLCYLHRQLPC